MSIEDCQYCKGLGVKPNMPCPNCGAADPIGTDKYLADAITEDIAEWLRDRLGYDKTYKIGFETKADIYNVVSKRLKHGIDL